MRSLEIKPDDFYGHQTLAMLAIRQAYVFGLEFIDANLIKDGVEHAQKAWKLRPNGTMFLLLARIYSLEASFAADESSRKKLDQMAEASLAAAKERETDPLYIGEVRLQRQFLQLRAATETSLLELKTKFLAISHEILAEFKDNPQWAAKKLVGQSRIARASFELVQRWQARHRPRCQGSSPTKFSGLASIM